MLQATRIHVRTHSGHTHTHTLTRNVVEVEMHVRVHRHSILAFILDFGIAEQ